MSVDHYTYRVTWSAEDDEHVGLCAEFRSLSWLAKTPEAALKGIHRVVSEAVTDMQSVGESGPPAPTLTIRDSCKASSPYKRSKISYNRSIKSYEIGAPCYLISCSAATANAH